MKGPKIHAVVFTAALCHFMSMMPQYSASQLIIDEVSGRISDNEESNNDNKNNPTTAVTSDNEHRMYSSPFFKPSSFFSDFFNLQDDLFDNVFRKDFHSFLFPSILDRDENDNLVERNFFFQSPFDDLANSLGGRLDDHHDQGLVPAPHSFLRGGIGLNNFFSSIHPTNIQLVDDDTTYQVSMRLPTEIQVEDVDVHLDNSGTRLVVEGRTSTTTDDNNISGNDLDPKNVATTTTRQHFLQSFVVDPKIVEVDRFVASVKDGRLTISAPKDRRKIKNVHHSIPIQNLNDIRSIPSSSGLTSDATRFAQGLSANDVPVETLKDNLSEEFKSVRDELTRKRNDQMSKFTKLGLESAINGGRDGDNDKYGEPSSSKIEDDDPRNIIRKNSNNWKEVSESTL